MLALSVGALTTCKFGSNFFLRPEGTPWLGLCGGALRVAFRLSRVCLTT